MCEFEMQRLDHMGIESTGERRKRKLPRLVSVASLLRPSLGMTVLECRGNEAQPFARTIWDMSGKFHSKLRYTSPHTPKNFAESELSSCPLKRWKR